MASFNQLAISSKDDSSKTLSKRDIFLLTYRKQQAWSLPDNIIYYITKNPSTSKCYAKIIQTCKHFFIKNPILVVRKFRLGFKNNRWDARFDEGDIDLNKITSKIWVVNEIFIFNYDPTKSRILSPIITKVCQSDIKVFFLFKQNIYFDHLKFLASKCEHIKWNAVTVMNENGSVVPLENIIEILSNVKHFVYNFLHADRSTEIISSETASELLKISHFSKLASFELYGIPEAFDMETFYDYIKKNKETKILLLFNNNISDGYNARLQAIVDKIVENECREYKPPFIDFYGMTDSSREKMWILHWAS